MPERTRRRTHNTGTNKILNSTRTLGDGDRERRRRVLARENNTHAHTTHTLAHRERNTFARKSFGNRMNMKYSPAQSPGVRLGDAPRTSHAPLIELYGGVSTPVCRCSRRGHSCTHISLGSLRCDWAAREHKAVFMFADLGSWGLNDCILLPYISDRNTLNRDWKNIYG